MAQLDSWNSARKAEVDGGAKPEIIGDRNIQRIDQAFWTRGDAIVYPLGGPQKQMAPPQGCELSPEKRRYVQLSKNGDVYQQADVYLIDLAAKDIQRVKI
jgi:hypothetical protein